MHSWSLIALCICCMRYHWFWATLYGTLHELYHESLPLPLHWGYNGATAWFCYMRYAMAMLWLHYVYYDCCIRKERGCVMAAMPARRNKCVRSSDGFSSILPASLLKPCLSFVQRTVCRVRYSKTIDITNRISNMLLSIDILFDIIVIPSTQKHIIFVVWSVSVIMFVVGKFWYLFPAPNLQIYFSHWFLLCPMLSFHLLLCSLSFSIFYENFNNFSLLYKSEV